jgi:hypothetical protein
LSRIDGLHIDSRKAQQQADIKPMGNWIALTGQILLLELLTVGVARGYYGSGLRPWLGRCHSQEGIKLLETNKFARFICFLACPKYFKIALAIGPPFDRFCVPVSPKRERWFTANP